MASRKKARYSTASRTAGGRRKFRGKKGSFAKAVKKVILSTAEKCWKSVNSEGFSMKHDLCTKQAFWDLATPSVAIFPSQGNSDSDRRGDEIYTSGIMMRAVLQVPSDRRNVTIKPYFVQYDASQGDPGDKTQFFHSISNNVLIDPLQTERFPGVKPLGTYRCRASDSEDLTDKTILIKKWIPMKKKLTFKTDATAVPTNLKTYGAIIWACYDTVTSSIIDTVVTNAEVTFTLYYRDP